jgi:hypothetical protein
MMTHPLALREVGKVYRRGGTAVRALGLRMAG